MTVVFYIAGVVAVIATLLVITRRNTIHALLYLIVSLFAVAVVFYTLGAPFVAALEVIVYAGAIVVLFLFTVMLLNIGRESEAEERRRVRPVAWIGPSILAAVLLVELAVAVASGATAQVGARAVEPREVGVALYGPYAIGVELASTLLLAALIGARHLGQRQHEHDIGELAGAGVAAAGPQGGGPDAGGPAGGPADEAGEKAPAEEPEPALVGDEEPEAAPRTTRFWRKDEP